MHVKFNIVYVLKKTSSNRGYGHTTHNVYFKIKSDWMFHALVMNMNSVTFLGFLHSVLL